MRRLVYTFRFIDDLLTINDGGIFDKVWNQIYPPELELKHENKKSSEVSFLDLQMEVEEGRLRTSLYDKRDGFNFEIVRMPFLESCIPDRIFYATIMSEVLRIARATTHLENFKNTTNVLLRRMKKQGADERRTYMQMRKMMRKHCTVFQKFGDGVLEDLMSESTVVMNR